MSEQTWPNDFAPHIRNKTFSVKTIRAALRFGALRPEQLPDEIKQALKNQ